MSASDVENTAAPMRAEYPMDTGYFETATKDVVAKPPRAPRWPQFAAAVATVCVLAGVAAITTAKVREGHAQGLPGPCVEHFIVSQVLVLEMRPIRREPCLGCPARKQVPSSVRQRR